MLGHIPVSAREVMKFLDPKPGGGHRRDARERVGIRGSILDA